MKDAIIRIKVSPAELTELSKRAGAVGYTLAEYVRFLVFPPKEVVIAKRGGEFTHEDRR